MTRLNIKDFDITMWWSVAEWLMWGILWTEQSSAEEGTLVRSVRHRRMLNFSLCSCALCGRCLWCYAVLRTSIVILSCVSAHITINVYHLLCLCCVPKLLNLVCQRKKMVNPWTIFKWSTFSVAFSEGPHANNCMGMLWKWHEKTAQKILCFCHLSWLAAGRYG